MPNVFRNIPSVNELLESPPLKKLLDGASRNAVVSGVRQFLEGLRSDLQTAAAEAPVPGVGELAERIAEWIAREDQDALRPVINATGVLLHTGLGRAPLADAAVEAVKTVATRYCNLEVDLATGARSHRARAVEPLLKRLTGAEASLVVNNNAAATVLTLAALAAGREVIVSRGQLVEIGGSYRLPEVMAVSGARLREVGTTNKTRIDDYRDAIGTETAALMQVHTSNFKVVGFQEQAALSELVSLARRRKIPLIDDIGSGALVDLSEHGIEDEPTAPASVKAGADVVLFSGDKLLGGPQCGIIVGRRELIQQISRHPLARAVRVDKTTLAALSATLALYEAPGAAWTSVPLLSMLTTSLENLRNRAQRLAPQLLALDEVAAAEVREEFACLGGGAVPAQQIPTCCVAVTPARRTVDALARALRCGKPSVYPRVRQDQLLLDLRTVLPGQDSLLVDALRDVKG